MRTRRRRRHRCRSPRASLILFSTEEKAGQTLLVTNEKQWKGTAWNGTLDDDRERARERERERGELATLESGFPANRTLRLEDRAWSTLRLLDFRN